MAVESTVAKLMVMVGLDSSALSRGIGVANQQVQSLAGTMQSAGAQITGVGTRLTMGVTVPIIGMGVASVRAAGDMDAAMRSIQSISKQTDDQIAALSQTFVDMSSNASVTRDSAVALAEAYYSIQGSGFAGANAMTILEVATKAASAGLTTTDSAARAITATLNAYGMDASEAARVSDVLFRTMDIGVVTFEELAANLGDVVGTAAIAGVSIEEVGAAYATMTKGGISAAEATTALNQLMLTYIRPSKDALELASKLGIEFSAQALSSKGLSGAIGELVEKVGLYEVVMTGADDAVKAQIKTIDDQIRALDAQKLALGGATKANKAARDAIDQQRRALVLQKDELRNSIDENVDYNLVMTEMSRRTGITVEQLAELFPNVRALKGALALTREEGQAFAGDMKAIGDASGATADAFAIQAKSFEFQWSVFKNALQGLKIAFGNELLPVLIPFVQKLTELISVFGKLPSPVKESIIKFLGLAAALGPVLIIVGKFLTIGGKVISLCKSLLGPIQWLASGILTLNPAVLAVIAVVGLLYLAFKTNFLGIRDMCKEVGDAIAASFRAIKAVVQRFFDFLSDRATWDQVKGEWTAACDYLFGKWAGLDDRLREIWDRSVAGMREWASTVVGTIEEWFGGIVEKVRGWLGEAGSIVGEFFKNLWTSLGGIWAKLIGKSRDGAAGVQGAWEILRTGAQVFADISVIAIQAWSDITQATQVNMDAIRLAVITTYGILRVETGDTFTRILSIIIGALTATQERVAIAMDTLRAAFKARLDLMVSDAWLAAAAINAAMASIVSPYGAPAVRAVGGALGAGGGTVNNSQPINVTINNPVREASGQSVMRTLRTLGALGMLIESGA